jgi:hypothetical protein
MLMPKVTQTQRVYNFGLSKKYKLCGTFLVSAVSDVFILGLQFFTKTASGESKIGGHFQKDNGRTTSKVPTAAQLMKIRVHSLSTLCRREN